MARRNEKRAWYKPSTKRLPPTLLIDWHLPNHPTKITSVACFSSMQIFHAWEKCRLADLLRFSQTRELKNSKATFKTAFFAAVNHNYDHKQWTLKHRNTQNGSKSTNHRSQTLTFWTRLSKVLFPKRSFNMIDGSEKRKRQLVFELQSSRVYEKRSKKQLLSVNFFR